jgi:hypothetical protein
MFLDVEMTRIEVGFHSEERDFLIRESLRPCDTDGIGDKLYDVRTNGDVWVAEQKQGVER